ncbi:MAG: zinc ribbon domain-containing protein [Clostridiales bacterium]|nr:zinc ribbon domain-containing protein [Clostridiales bacterium]
MLEIFAIISLCRVNKNNAIKNGRRPGGFIALTIILWVVFELIGTVAGYIILGSDNGYLAVMLIALPCAALGGLISFLITKNVSPGNYVDPSMIHRPVVTVGPNGTPVYQDPNVPAYMYQQVPVQPVQPVMQQGAGPVTGTRYCKYCGAPNKSTSKFCESCGQNIG